MTYNLPTPFHEIDSKIQDKINKIPQECPLCHTQTIMELKYSRHDDNLRYSSHISYDLEGHCRNCGIRWSFSITTD